MVKPNTVSETVLAILWDEYTGTIKYQRETNQIQVTFNFDEYLSLWTKHRITSIETAMARGPRHISKYLRGANRPVCGWITRDCLRRGGKMSINQVRIMSATESKKMFQFQKGDNHTAESKEKISASRKGKKQTPEQIEKRTTARVATMARKREEKELK